MTMSYDEFVEFYNIYGRTPNQISKPNHSLTVQELETKYRKYLQSEIRKEERKKEQIKKQRERQRDKSKKIDTDLLEVYAKVNKRDHYKCRLMRKLKYEQLTELKQNAWEELLDIIDHAHYLRRLSYPHLKYDKDNIVLLNRYSHSMLDQLCNPLNGKAISVEEHESWWKLILGPKQHKKLMEKING